jgi:cytochrome P450
VAAARNWETFSSAEGSSPVPLETGGDFKLMPISTDPPFQRELRHLIDPHFNPRKVFQAEGWVRETVIELVERFQERGACDFTAEYAKELPATVFFGYAFGTDPHTSGLVMHWLDDMLKTPNKAQEAAQAFFGWTKGLINERRASATTRDDVLNALLTGTVGGRELSDSERMMVIMNLIIGGVETTTHVLGNVIRILATRPDIVAKLDADRSLIPAAVEEFLRYEAPNDARGRVATCPVTIGDAEIPAKERVALFYSAANRDPATYERADEIDLERFVGPAKPHLSFGAGPHRCPGAHLARLEIRVTIEEVLDRFKDLRLSADHVDYCYGLTRGPLATPVTFRPYVP